MRGVIDGSKATGDDVFGGVSGGEESEGEGVTLRLLFTCDRCGATETPVLQSSEHDCPMNPSLGQTTHYNVYKNELPSGWEYIRSVMVCGTCVSSFDKWRSPIKQPVSTVSQETITRRGKAALDKWGPALVESVRITEEGNQHIRHHEWASVADCRSCQEEKAKA